MLSQQTKDSLKYNYLAAIYCKYWTYTGHKQLTINNHTTTIPINSHEEAFELYVITQTEQQLLQTLLTNLNPDDTFLDIGANIGIHSILAANKIKTGTIYAIEPHPQNYQTLTQNIKKTNNQNTIKPLNFGLTNRNTLLELTNSQTINGSAHITDTHSKTDTITIPAKNGDCLIEEHKITPNTIKIDVEGAEGLVIDGLSNTLKSNDCTTLIIEIHHPNPNNNRPAITDYNWTQDQLHSKLTTYGFSKEHEYPRNYETQLIYTK